MRVAVLDDYEGAASSLGDWGSLEPEIKTDVYRDHLVGTGELVNRLKPYDILVVMRERTPFPRGLIDQLPHLKLLVTTGLRNNAIDTAACKEKGIVVSGTDSSKTPPVELTWGLILSLMRRISQMDRSTRDGRWGDGIGTGLDGKVLGLLGLGYIGARVAKVGAAFNMKVKAWSQNLTTDRAFAAGAERVEKEELFRSADILSVHLVLSERTRGLVGTTEIGWMKPSAVLVNTSRGPIIQEEALIEALRSSRIAGAGLDVFETEPLSPDHPLLSLSNTLVTPHIGYVTRENFKTYFTQAVEDIAAWLKGKPIRLL